MATAARQQLSSLPSEVPLKMPMNREFALGTLLAGLLTGGGGASLAGGVLEGGAETAKEQQALRQAALDRKRQELQQQLLQAQEALTTLGGFRAKTLSEAEMERQRLAETRAQFMANLEMRKQELEMDRLAKNAEIQAQYFNMRLLRDQNERQALEFQWEAMKPFMENALRSRDPMVVGAAMGEWYRRAKEAGATVTPAQLVGAVNETVKSNLAAEKALRAAEEKTGLELRTLRAQAEMAEKTLPYEVQAAAYKPKQAAAELELTKAQAGAAYRANRGGGGGGGGSSIRDLIALNEAQRKALDAKTRPFLERYDALTKQRDAILNSIAKVKGEDAAEQQIRLRVRAEELRREAQRQLRLALAVNPGIRETMGIPANLWPDPQAQRGLAFEQYTRQLLSSYPREEVLKLYDEHLTKNVNIDLWEFVKGHTWMDQYATMLQNGWTFFGPDGQYLGKWVNPKTGQSVKPGEKVPSTTAKPSTAKPSTTKSSTAKPQPKTGTTPVGTGRILWYKKVAE